ncbi:hypothetical protein LV75_003220 [Actinokineospora diospyrosa]|uniref:Uncharacterized protein n=1 Tax=Actinokineospora diospyrosa TaxID=103728 RepID=A0ABT1IDP4_9PSEU|nr:hypothetical protein [Actinokineospora diospyrosa]
MGWGDPAGAGLAPAGPSVHGLALWVGRTARLPCRHRSSSALHLDCTASCQWLGALMPGRSLHPAHLPQPPLAEVAGVSTSASARRRLGLAVSARPVRGPVGSARACEALYRRLEPVARGRWGCAGSGCGSAPGATGRGPVALPGAPHAAETGLRAATAVGQRTVCAGPSTGSTCPAGWHQEAGWCRCRVVIPGRGVDWTARPLSLFRDAARESGGSSVTRLAACPVGDALGREYGVGPVDRLGVVDRAPGRVGGGPGRTTGGGRWISRGRWSPGGGCCCAWRPGGRPARSRCSGSANRTPRA